MAAEQVDINKMPLAGGNVNAPASGTYGEGAALERLKQSLPMAETGAAPSAADPTAPMPTPPAGGMSTPPTGGLPSPLLAPTQRPDVPVSTPLGAPTAPMPATGRQQRMAILDALANSPDVSDETREWASMMVKRLVDTSRAQ